MKSLPCLSYLRQHFGAIKYTNKAQHIITKKKLNFIDNCISVIGKSAAWLSLLMVITTFLIVILRYIFGFGFVWLHESLIWMHGTIFMLGISYTMSTDEHVKVDILYRSFTKKTQLWVNFFGFLFLVFPFCIFLYKTSWDFVLNSWSVKEISRDAGGLPYPGLPLLKTMLLIMPALIGIKSVSIFIRIALALKS